MNDDEIMKMVEMTLDEVYKNEEYIFVNDVCERNLVFHFARYFYHVYEKYNGEKNYSIDCEYNRNRSSFNERKYKELVYDGKKHKIYPDVILHQRGSNDNNILAIEFKKYNNINNKEREKDFMKLEALTDRKLAYKYKLGLFIVLGKARGKVKIYKFKDGKKLGDVKRPLYFNTKLNNE